MIDLIAVAQFADLQHKGQFRKYGNIPYITHPARIASQVMLHTKATSELVAAAWLHDTIEDCGTTYEQIADRFGDKVAMYVNGLTNPSHGSKAPRTERKKMDREHLASQVPEVKLIKLFDRIDNLSDLTLEYYRTENSVRSLQHAGICTPTDELNLNKQEKFLKLYREESRLLLEEALIGTDAALELELKGWYEASY